MCVILCMYMCVSVYVSEETEGRREADEGGVREAEDKKER